MAANPIRMARLHDRSGAWLMVPLDHGVSSGPIAGVAKAVDIKTTLTAVAPHATCVTVHRGLMKHAAPFADRLGMLLHLSASTDMDADPHDKRLVATVGEAARLGCDGVSLHVNVGATTESHQLDDFGAVAGQCGHMGMPLVAMMYPRGPKVKNPFDPNLVAHAARLGAELGADAIKVPYTGSEASFRRVVDGCPAPVLVAGGAKRADFKGLIKDLHAARNAGARGVSIGRNVFQDARPREAMARIAAVFA